MSQVKNDDADIWGSAPLDKSSKSTSSPISDQSDQMDSAFSDSVMIDAESNLDGNFDDDGQSDASMYSAADVQAGAHEVNEVAVDAGAKNKPNVALLAGAGVILLVVLGAIGFFGYKKYVKKTNGTEAAATSFGSFAPAVAPVMPVSAPAMVFPPTSSSVAEGANDIFAVNPAVSASAQISNSNSLSSSVPEVPASSVSSTSTVTTSSSTSIDPIVNASHAAAEKTSATNFALQASPAASSVSAATAITLTSKVPSTEPTCACEKSTEKQKSKSALAAPVKQKFVSSESRFNSSRRVAKNSQKTKRNTTKNGSNGSSGLTTAPKELVLLTRPMRVVAVFPLTGKNAQAWIQDSTGRIQIVRKNESIDGVRILEIIPEDGVVKTTGGNIVTTGLSGNLN